MDKIKQENWSKRYKERTEELKPPSEFLMNNIDSLQKGTVLDLACGDGSNAVFLAKQGFSVTGVDFSEEALKRLAKFSAEEGVNIETKIIDVDNKQEVLGIGKFDNIVISKFKPQTDVFKVLPQLLNDNGTILFTSFNFRQSEISDFSRKHTLEEREFEDLSDEISLVKLETLVEHGKHIDGYIFKKN